MTVVYSKEQVDAMALPIANAIRDAMASVVLTDQNNGAPLKIWTGTQAQYNAVTTKDNGTLYVVKT